jgi:indole-3-acetate monooxygenase
MPELTPLAQAIRARADEIRALGEQAEAERHLPDELVKVLTDLAMFHIYVPKRHGGLELDVVDGLLAIEELSSIDPASGWCVLKGAGSNQMSATWPDELAAEVLTGTDVVVAGSLNPRGTAVAVDGGYRLNGHWDWGTATSFAKWVLAGARVVEADGMTPVAGPTGGPKQLTFLVPKEHVTIIDTWDTYGMRGTASNDFTVENVVLPARYALAGGPAAVLPEGDLYRVPGFMWMAVPHAAVSIGIARGCLEATIDLATKKTPLMSSTLLKEKPAARDAVGRAAAMVRAARAYLFETVTETWAAEQVTPELVTHMHLAATHAVHAAVEVVNLCSAVAGGSSVYARSPIQRFFRDAHVAATHFLVNAEKFPAAGRVLLGDAMSMMQPL